MTKLTRFIAGGVAFIMLVLSVAYVSVSTAYGNWNPLQWNELRQSLEKPDNDNNDNNTGGNGGNMDVIENNGILLCAAQIPEEEFEAYNVSETAAMAYHITATVNEDAADKSIIGNIGWENKTSSWANGKSISDYATLTQTPQYGLEFTLEIKQAFGEPILIKVASCMDSNVNATAKVNYLKEFQAFTAVINSSLSPTAMGRLYVGDTINTVTITPVFGVGTIEGTITDCTTVMTINNYTKTGLNAALNTGSGTSSYSASDKITARGLSFKIPFSGNTTADSASGIITGGGNYGAALTIVNNFIKNHGCQDTGGTGSQTAGVSDITYTVTYKYGEYSKTLTYKAGGSGFRNDNLTLISTITDIELSETDIVILPQ